MAGEQRWRGRWWTGGQGRFLHTVLQEGSECLKRVSARIPFIFEKAHPLWLGLGCNSHWRELCFFHPRIKDSPQGGGFACSSLPGSLGGAGAPGTGEVRCPALRWPMHRSCPWGVSL